MLVEGQARSQSEFKISRLTLKDFPLYNSYIKRINDDYRLKFNYNILNAQQ